MRVAEAGAERAEREGSGGKDRRVRGLRLTLSAQEQEEMSKEVCLTEALGWLLCRSWRGRIALAPDPGAFFRQQFLPGPPSHKVGSVFLSDVLQFCVVPLRLCPFDLGHRFHLGQINANGLVVISSQECRKCKQSL